jgi:hypothetical protein
MHLRAQLRNADAEAREIVRVREDTAERDEQYPDGGSSPNPGVHELDDISRRTNRQRLIFQGFPPTARIL